MKIIGLDFGTTNSTISFLNVNSDTLDSFKLRAGAKDYIPTIVSYSEEEDITIGDPAKKKITSKEHEVYDNFKLLLGKNCNEVIKGKTKTSLRVASDFIKKLLEDYVKSQRINNIDGITMTVPDIWFREKTNLTARENIKNIYKELGYGGIKFRLESEPVAAVAYFCRTHERNKETNPEGKKYNGFVTVIDYGGGTLDITLCKITNGKRIEVLERSGFGEFNDTNGCAGVAFDEAVIERLISKKNLDIKKGDKKFIKLRNEFEDWKIEDCEAVTKHMKNYYLRPATVKSKILFSLEYGHESDTLDVYCEDLDCCFKKANAPELTKSLKQIELFFDVHKIDYSSHENFKVLLVGGFSNFIAVEKEVRNFFKTELEYDDIRFKLPFPTSDIALSISKGAAWIANGRADVVHTCKLSYGYVVNYENESYKMVQKDIPVINKGTNLEELADPVFIKNAVGFSNRSGNKSGILTIFMDDGRPDKKGRMCVDLDQSVEELFPDVDSNKNYYIGFSLDEDEIPAIHVKDELGSMVSTSLNKLIERIAVIEK